VEGLLAAKLLVVELPGFEVDRGRAIFGVFKVLDALILSVLFFGSFVSLFLFIFFGVVLVGTLEERKHPENKIK
jgi:hypothetical protein